VNPADLRATVEAEVLTVVSGHGGEVLVAGPQSYQLVQELTDLVLDWHRRAAEEAGQPAAPETMRGPGAARPG
jgi:hypothetical protein